MHIDYHDLGYPQTDILIPGWSTCPQLLMPLSHQANRLLCYDPDPHQFVTVLDDYLSTLPTCSYRIIAFSLGCFLACDVAHLSKFHIQKFSFYSARPAYHAREISAVKKELLDDPLTFLRQFLYQDCTDSQNPLLDTYIHDHDKDKLLSGLAFLSVGTLTPDRIHVFHDRVTFYHGKRDRIAPLREISRLATSCHCALNTFDGGHFFFLRPDF